MSPVPNASSQEKPGAFFEIQSPAYPRLALCALFLLWLVFTKPVDIGGDTFWYVLDIRNTAGHPWTDSAPIWNFAHLIWRPLGSVLAAAFLPLVEPLFGNDAQASITFLLVTVNVLAALACCLIVQSAVWRITGKAGISTFVAAAFLCFNTVLNYSRTGSPYVFALACSTGALYLAAFSPASRARAAWAGILSGIAAASWIPFVLSFPAIVLARPILTSGRGEKFDFRFAPAIVLGGGATLAIFYGAGMAAAHITSPAALAAWIHASSQEVHDRTLLRMITGVVRSLYDLGYDGVWFKWYVFHDPYAHVGLADLLQASLARIAIFYVTLAFLIISLWSSSFGRRLLLLLAILAPPHIALALAYESGDPSRYSPLVGLLAVAFGYVTGNARFSVPKRVLAAVLCFAPALANLAAANSASIDVAVRRDVARIGAIPPLQPVSRLYVVNLRDSLFHLRYSAPFHPINRQPLPEIDTVVPWIDVPFWRRTFACSVLATWQHQGQVWVTTRVLADRPVRSWLWVEGDDRRITWEAIYRFFRNFDHSEIRGGEDGFFRVMDTDENRRLVVGEIAGGDVRTCANRPAPAQQSE